MSFLKTTIATALTATIAIVLSACATNPPTPPFRPVVNVMDLMESSITHAAEVYWDSTAVVVDADGIHELFPETDEDWDQVWAAAVTIAESGNLLMMAPRRVDDGLWMQYARQLVDAGNVAIEAAVARDPERVLDAGEVVYNACTVCHTAYVTD